jgi:hypothetical protein
MMSTILPNNGIDLSKSITSAKIAEQSFIVCREEEVLIWPESDRIGSATGLTSLIG